MKMIVAITSGTNDPTRATLGMMAAKTALELGHDVTVWLQGEGVVLANARVYDKIVGHNLPPMKDLADFLVDLGVEFWICQACGEGRNVVPDNFLATAKYMTMDDYIKAVAEFDRSLSF